jgi:hypothetical protein
MLNNTVGAALDTKILHQIALYGACEVPTVTAASKPTDPKIPHDIP